MSIAAIAWVVLACVIAVAVLIVVILLIPELRRYMRIREM
jgi:hypothetical protein